jgi:hypothetical protein
LTTFSFIHHSGLHLHFVNFFPRWHALNCERFGILAFYYRPYFGAWRMFGKKR